MINKKDIKKINYIINLDKTWNKLYKSTNYDTRHEVNINISRKSSVAIAVEQILDHFYEN
jgi:hypothetical protein